MPRIQTGTVERVKQNREMQEQVSAETGRHMTISDAAAYRRAQRGPVKLRTLSSEIELDITALESIGALIGAIQDFRIQPGGYATLRLTTDGHSYTDILSRAALLSQSHNLIIDLYLTPKPPEDEDAEDAEHVYKSRLNHDG